MWSVIPTAVKKWAAIAVVALLTCGLLWFFGKQKIDAWIEADATKRVQSIQAKVKTLQDQVKQQEDVVAAAQADAVKAKADIQTWKTTVAQLQKANEALRATVAQLDAQRLAAQEAAQNVPAAQLLPAIRSRLSALRPVPQSGPGGAVGPIVPNK